MEETTPTVEVNLSGEYRFKADSKGRLSLPAKFRKVLPDELKVTLDPKQEHLLVFTPADYDVWLEETMQNLFDKMKDLSREDKLGYRRAFKAIVKDVQIDTAGRIMIPADQREKAGIDKEVVIIGNTGYFELWDAKRYEPVSEKYDLSLALL